MTNFYRASAYTPKRTRDIDLAIRSVCPPSVRDTPVLCQNDWTYRRKIFFTDWHPHNSNRWGTSHSWSVTWLSSLFGYMTVAVTSSLIINVFWRRALVISLSSHHRQRHIGSVGQRRFVIDAMMMKCHLVVMGSLNQTAWCCKPRRDDTDVELRVKGDRQLVISARLFLHSALTLSAATVQLRSIIILHRHVLIRLDRTLV